MYNIDKFDSIIDREMAKESLRLDTEYILKGARKRPKEESFKDVFKEEEIKNDILLKDALKRKFKEQIEHLPSADLKRIESGQERADALEVIICEQGELHQWAGEKAHFSMTTEYDDLINGVDAIIEFEQQEKDGKTQKVALVVDASMNEDFSVLLQKINRNKEKVLSGSLAQVKYFESTIDGKKETLKHVIPVVMGLEGKHVNELTRKCASIKRIQSLKEKSEISEEILKKAMDELDRHPAQMIFFEEIESQLNFYKSLLIENKKQFSQEHIHEIEEILSIFKEIRLSKKDIKLGDYKNDGMLELIKTFTTEQKNQ